MKNHSFVVNIYPIGYAVHSDIEGAAKDAGADLTAMLVVTVSDGHVTISAVTDHVKISTTTVTTIKNDEAAARDKAAREKFNAQR